MWHAACACGTWGGFRTCACVRGTWTYSHARTTFTLSTGPTADGPRPRRTRRGAGPVNKVVLYMQKGLGYAQSYGCTAEHKLTLIWNLIRFLSLKLADSCTDYAQQSQRTVIIYSCRQPSNGASRLREVGLRARGRGRGA